MATVSEFEGDLLSAIDLFSQHILPKTIHSLTLADVSAQTPVHLSTFFPELQSLTLRLGFESNPNAAQQVNYTAIFKAVPPTTQLLKV